MTPTPVRSIALVRLSALGDVTMMLAVVRALQRALPQAIITWFIGAAAHALLGRVTGIDFEVVAGPRVPRDYLRFGRRLRDRRFEVLLATQASLRANLLYPWIRAPRRIGFDRVRARDGQWLFTNARIPFVPRQHLLESFFAFAAEIGVGAHGLDWRIPLATADRHWARARIPRGPGPLLVINPAASKAERNWLPERYAAVAAAAHRYWGTRVVLTGGPAPSERRLAVEIHSHLEIPVTDLIGATTPRQLAAVLEAADCVLAPDTGPAHIAAAMGAPVVGLYAVAPAWLAAPYTCRALVIDRYEAAVRSVLGRDPTRLPWGVRVHDARAMALIGVDEVVQQIGRVLAGSGVPRPRGG